ncbi:MAG TPA: hypothetical protein VNB64_11765 [Solirubrobacteraceae bacterium]|nr:hypothetical protein [Solirubrobacteraceae bacterium]
MTALRLISLPTHAVLELAGGLVLMAIPFLLGFTPAGLVAAVAVGALVVGLALSATATDGSGLHIAAHFAFDRGIALGLLGGALVLGLAGDTAAAAVFAAASLGQAALNLTTRYTARA